MKKILYPILALCATMFLSGCEDRLDIEQKGVISADDFYQTDADAQNALNNLYQCFAYHIAGNEGVYVALPVLFNEAGDDMLAAGNMYGDNDFGAEINEFRYTYQNQVIENTYKGLYAVIYDANTIIDRVPDDSPIKKRVRAEAITLRAWSHLMLAIGWDCPPLVETVLPGDARPSNYEGGHVELLRWCAEQAESVVNDLEERISPTD
ncbi:RagB/SusD family nutrient uptake outer membrane protein, partial [uncultured Muribaculum sp.]|uniref:RagB/SusD family nutrient uptake outer membrane protein n=1 Tax=uncultured Muribaculum sp. TaxID=1918613 RepID=UPI00272AF08C